MASKQPDERQAKIDALRKKQRSSDRRRTVLVVGSTVAVVVILIGLVTYAIVTNRQPSDLAGVGAPMADAACGEIVADETTGVSNHVGPGTNTPDQTRIEYATVPPSSGIHFASPQFPAQAFYTADDRPPLENLVHNLEHGYTVVWYSESVTEEQLAQLRQIGRLGQEEADTNGKFIVSAWDDSYGELPAETPIAMSHWGAEQGHRQLCGAPSGEAVLDFIEQFPATDSPEPNGA